jgi:hypothetical protein
MFLPTVLYCTVLYCTCNAMYNSSVKSTGHTKTKIQLNSIQLINVASKHPAF